MVGTLLRVGTLSQGYGSSASIESMLSAWPQKMRWPLLGGVHFKGGSTVCHTSTQMLTLKGYCLKVVDHSYSWRCPFDRRASHGHPMQVDRTLGQAWSVRVGCPMDMQFLFETDLSHVFSCMVFKYLTHLQVFRHPLLLHQ